MSPGAYGRIGSEIRISCCAVGISGRVRRLTGADVLRVTAVRVPRRDACLELVDSLSRLSSTSHEVPYSALPRRFVCENGSTVQGAYIEPSGATDHRRRLTPSGACESALEASHRAGTLEP